MQPYQICSHQDKALKTCPINPTTPNTSRLPNSTKIDFPHHSQNQLFANQTTKMTKLSNLPYSYTLTLIILLLSSSTLSTASITPPTKRSSSSSSPHKSFSKIIAFGDSLTDTGNTVSETGPSGFNYVSNLPYGMTFFHHPTNRYCDGRLVIDFVAEKLALPYLPPYRSGGGASNGVNFAVGGSTAIEHKFFVRNNLTFDITPESIGTQLNWFNKYLAKQGCGQNLNDQVRCGALFNDALVWVGEIGANDYAYAAESKVSKSVLQNLVIKRMSSFLEAILKKGAKYVVVQGLPPTGCLTLSMFLAPTDDRDELGCVRSVNNQSISHNTLLLAKIQDLRKQYPQSTIVYADYYNAYRDIFQSLNKYGFKEAFKACCGSGDDLYNYDFFTVCGSTSAKFCSDPAKFINWDGVHLTEAMNKAVSGLILQGVHSHPSFQDLVNRKMSQV